MPAPARRASCCPAERVPRAAANVPARRTIVARERGGLIGRRGYAALAPDLVAEIISPEDRPAELLEKVADWLDAGVRLAWVIDSTRAEVRVYRPDGSLSVLSDMESLVGEDVLPGFVCVVRDILN